MRSARASFSRSVAPAIPRQAVNGVEEDTVVGVAELDRRLRRAVEEATGDYWIEGEVCSLKRAVSGHLYFTLKDEVEEATIDCVMYRFDALRAQRYVRDGARIQLFGRATIWAPRGRLQLVGQRARPAGRGALLVALEELKRKLVAEGLFDVARKRRLPSNPRIVGVVTSGTGAAFHDIRTVAFRRGRVRLVLSAALVQGDGAPESLLRAIARLERYPGLDVMIIGRGGGSGEDLMAFNDERVVRRICALKVPVVSAVGHETDVSLADLAADVRAATPSQAAELVVPDSAQQAEALSRQLAVLKRAICGRLLLTRTDVERHRGKLSDPRFIIAQRQQELDELETRLRRRLDRSLARRHQVVNGWLSRISARHPRAVIAESRGALQPLSERLRASMRLELAALRAELGARASGLQAMSPLSVLGRGYAIALGADGRAVRRAADVRVGDALQLRVAQGSLLVSVRGVLGDEDGPASVPRSEPETEA